MYRMLAVLIFTVGLTGAIPAALAQSTGAVAQNTTTSPAEMLKGAQDALANIQAASEEVVRIVGQAREEEDDDAIVCAEAKKANVDAVYGVAQIADGAMRQAINDAQIARADHEYRKIGVMETKASQFLSEARTECLGDGVADSSGTSISTNQPSDDNDETDGPGISDGVVGVDPPGTTPME